MAKKGGPKKHQKLKSLPKYLTRDERTAQQRAQWVRMKRREARLSLDDISSGIFPFDRKPENISMEQYEAFLTIEASDKPTFITGNAGTGKSTLLRFFVSNTLHKGKLVVGAPTGPAALNVGGSTLHRIVGLTVSKWPLRPKEAGSRLGGYNPTLRKTLLKNLELLVIDEVSMVRADVMDAIDRALRNAKDSDSPFGGIKVVMFGDPYQLPPVVTQTWTISDAGRDYESPFFFSAHVFSNIQTVNFLLEETHRQAEPGFIRALNNIRKGDETGEDFNLLNSRVDSNAPEDALRLFSKNDAVDRHNQLKLSQLATESAVFLASRSGSFLGFEGKPRPEGPTADVLTLKVGAKVMFIKNDDQNNAVDADGLPVLRWANGTLGTVASLSRSGEVKVTYVDSAGRARTDSIEKSTWLEQKPVVTSYKSANGDIRTQIEQEIVGSFTQVPLKLSWAATIHKAQGATYDAVSVNFGSGTFASGQAYVALSRVRTLAGLYLEKRFTPDQLVPVDSSVKEFMNPQRFRTWHQQQYRESIRASQEKIAQKVHLELKSQEKSTRIETSLTLVAKGYSIPAAVLAKLLAVTKPDTSWIEAAEKEEIERLCDLAEESRLAISRKPLTGAAAQQRMKDAITILSAGSMLYSVFMPKLDLYTKGDFEKRNYAEKLAFFDALLDGGQLEDLRKFYKSVITFEK